MPTMPGAAPADADDAVSQVRELLRKLRYGAIAITVHDGRVVQLDVTEKRRLAR